MVINTIQKYEIKQQKPHKINQDLKGESKTNRRLQRKTEKRIIEAIINR